jgi:hypothetical protein
MAKAGLANRVLSGLVLGAVGLFATPALLFAAGWTVSAAYFHVPDVAQGYFSLLTFVSVGLAPFGALAWFIAGMWLAGRDPESSPSGSLLLGMQVGASLAFAAYLGSKL